MHEKYRNIAAYFMINGIKVSKPKEPDKQEMEWLKLSDSSAGDNRIFSEEILKKALASTMLPKDTFEQK